jgi:NitT/TauT family transport system substrate-binding protein
LIGRRDNMMRKATVLGVLLAGALVVAGCGKEGAASASGGAQGGDRISVGYYPGVSTSYLTVVAKDQGIFEKNGLDVELVQITSGPQQISALLGGSLTVADLPAPSIVPLMQKNAGAIQVLTGGEVFTYQLVAQPDVVPAGQTLRFPETLHAIKGKTVGIIQAGGTLDYFVRGLAKSAGMNPDKDYTMVGSGSAAANVAGFAGKKYDVTVVFPEQLAKLGTVNKDYVNLADSLTPETTNHLFDHSLESMLGTKADWVRDHPDQVRKFCLSMKQAEEYVTDPANATALKAKLQKQFQQSPDAVWPILQKSQFSPILTEADWNKQASTAGVDAMPPYAGHVAPSCQQAMAG